MDADALPRRAGLKRALYLPNFGPAAKPAVAADLATAAEDAGLQGFFIWDHLCPLDGEKAIIDPWRWLECVGVASRDLIIGPMIEPLPRLDPDVVAESAIRLVERIGERLIIGIGTGVPQDLEAAEVRMSVAERIAATEDGAKRIAEAVARSGFAIPLWTSGFWPRSKPFVASHFATGVFPIVRQNGGFGPPDSSEIAAIRSHLQSVGALGAVVAVSGRSNDSETDLDAYASSGLDWWLEDLWRCSEPEVRARIGALAAS